MRTFIDDEILELVQRKFPQIAELPLQEEIATVGKIMNFKAGEILMNFGSYIRIVPLVLEGVIKVIREEENGRELFLYYIQAGESCTQSFSCCMMNKKSEIKTIADDDTTIIGIPIQYVDAWMTKYQSWKNFVMMSYDNRMLELIKAIDSIAFTNMDERLIQYLNKKTKALGKDTVSITHQDIALDLNASREAVSRLLKKMEKDGLVELGRNRIKVL